MRKVTVNFYLNTKPDKKGFHVIFLYYSFGGKRYSVSTKETVNAKQWQKERMRIQSNVTGAVTANARLDKMRTSVELLFQPENISELPIQAQVSQIIESINPKKEMEAFHLPEPQKSKEATPLSVLSVLNEWIEDRVKNEADASVKNYKVFRNHITEYLLSKKLQDSTLSVIDIPFYEDFRHFLRDTKGHSINTEAKHTKTLGRFLRYCEKRGFPVNMAYKNFTWVSENAPDVVTLDITELAQIECAVMPSEHLEHIKDVFLFQLYCGMRFAGVFNLKKTDVNGDYISFFILKKTRGRTTHTVALHRKAKEILNKYQNLPGEKALPVISLQKSNQGLKEVGKIAELNRVVKKKMIYGNRSIITEISKHELLTTHMARRGFITIAISKNINESLIKANTGHEKDSRSFGRYYHVSNEDKKDMIDQVFGE